MTIDFEDDDLVAQLRGRARYLYNRDQVKSPGLMRQAAEEIETLRDKLRITVEMGDRNVPEHPTPTQYAPELVERMVALISKMEIGASSILEEYHPDNTGLGKTYREAVSIGRCLRGESDEAVDVVEQMRRESWVVDDSFAAMCVEAASRGIARGRQLQRGEAA